MIKEIQNIEEVIKTTLVIENPIGIKYASKKLYILSLQERQNMLGEFMSKSRKQLEDEIKKGTQDSENIYFKKWYELELIIKS